MSALLPASLRARAEGLQWRAPGIHAEVGHGTRAGNALGPGIEFAQYRAFEAGDDVRHLDKHVYGRLGRTVIRQFTQEQALRVHVLLDASASMGWDADKWRTAQQVAALCTLVSLQGGDHVSLLTAQAGRLEAGPRLTRVAMIDDALERLAQVTPGGRTERLEPIARASIDRMHGRGLVVVVSDWLMEDAHDAIRVWRAQGYALLALQVLGRTDVTPEADVRGWARLVDVETGEVLDRFVDEGTVQAYQEVVQAWQAELRASVLRAEGHWFGVRADRDDPSEILSRWQRMGLVT
ncbi:MAG: DUF58 domain-containing protein [Trueperaceae bacterium]|nr:DUF58 domain-containing protein [Trueperaceae bacterium]